jgi:RecD/TraA family predicted helicase
MAIVDFKCKVKKVLFPKTPLYAGCYAGLSVIVSEGYEHIYRDEKWGTTVIKGNIPVIDNETEYSIKAEMIEDEKYGKQYKIINMSNRNNKLEDNEEGHKFLKLLLTATQYGNLMNGTETPIKLLEEEDVKALSKIKGFGEKTALKLIGKYNANKGSSGDRLLLSKYNLTDHEQRALLNACEGNALVAVQKLKADPYFMCKIKGFGFKRVDDIVIRNEILLPKDKRRIKAYIEFLFKELGNNIGSTYTFVDDVYDTTMDILNMEKDEEYLISEALREMLDEGIIWTDENRYRIALREYYDLERDVAKELIRLKNCKGNLTFNNWEERIKKMEENQGWSLDEGQREASKSILNNKVFVTIGKAGSGKSSTLRAGLEMIEGEYKILQCCLSGKASNVLLEATGIESSTIHRALKFVPERGFTYDKNNKLDVDVCVIDEIGMVDLKLFYSLIQALPDKCYLIMLGDSSQLPNLSVGNLLEDMVNSEIIHINELTKIHRQGLNSKIKTTSFDVSNGKQITEKTENDYIIEDGDLKEIILNNRENILDSIISEYKKLLKTYSPQDISVITAKRDKGELSAFNINQEIQKVLYREGEKGLVVPYDKERNTKFHIGERVMNIQNNYKLERYDLDYSNMDEEEYKNNLVAIYNGQCGTITHIDYEKVELVIKFDNNIEVIFKKEDLSNIVLGSSFTVHKSQGSTIPATICVFSYSDYSLLSRQLVYTSITRAKHYCVLIAENKALRYAIRTNDVIRKNTFLCEMLKYYNR